MVVVVGTSRGLTRIVFPITIDFDDAPQSEVDFFFAGDAVIRLIRKGPLTFRVLAFVARRVYVNGFYLKGIRP